MNVYELTYEERAEILENAARAIQVRGWCQRAIIDKKGQVCAVGGIAYGAGWTTDQIDKGSEDGEIYHPKSVFRKNGEKPLETPDGIRILSIVDYNDIFATSSEDVVGALLERAKQLRAL